MSTSGSAVMPETTSKYAKIDRYKACLPQNRVFLQQKMRPFTLRVRSTNVLPKRLSLAQRIAPPASASTAGSRVILSRRPQWTCDCYVYARVHGIRSLATIAPIFSFNDNDPAMSNLTPPQPPAIWTHTPEQVTTLINELIVKDKAVWDKIGSLPPEECTFESVHLSPFHISEMCSLKDHGSWTGLR